MSLSADWAKFTRIADEHVMPSLARVRLDSLTQVNGSWTMTQDLVPVPKYRFARWKGRCRGVWRRGVCVFSIADLSTIIKARSALVNKVITKHDPAIGECLRDSVRQRVLTEKI